LLIVSLVLLAALVAYPVRNEITRGGILAALAGSDAGLLMVLWKRRRWFSTALAVQGLLALFLITPSRSYDAARLRAAYMSALQRFEGTRYVWGGETHLGVDCSGLLRAALVEAHVAEATRTANPGLLREAMRLWWHDASAREMMHGYRGNTLTISHQGTLAEAGAHMQPGDFAVTADGSHVLAYAGDGRWIEADPYVNRVIDPKPGEPSAWWAVKVVPRRWRMMAEEC
jgi:NlpC/P60 family